MPAYIVKIRKPEELRVKSRSFYKIRVTKNGSGSLEPDCGKRTGDGSGRYILCGKNGKCHGQGGGGALGGSGGLFNGFGTPLTNSGVSANGNLRDPEDRFPLRRDSNNNSEVLTNNNDDDVGGGLIPKRDALRIKASLLEDLSLEDDLFGKGAEAPARNGCLREPKICRIIRRSTAKKVDDVIEEILNLEEGLEAGKDSQKSPHTEDRIQGDNVPGTVCDLLGLNGFMGCKTSSSCPPDVPKVKTEPPTAPNDPQVVAIMKDRQKKDNHNMIERRRRFNINDRIRDLMHLLPKVNERYHENYRDTRHNKGQILTASVSYMRRLKADVEMQRVLEDRIKALEHDKKLLALRLKELENLLRVNGINFEDASKLGPAPSPPSSFTPTPPTTASPFVFPHAPASSPLTPTATPNFPTAPSVAGSDLVPPRCETEGGGDLVGGGPPEGDLTPAETTDLLNDLGVKKVNNNNNNNNIKCPDSSHLPDFLLEELFLDNFGTEGFGLNLMDDESFTTLTSDPLLSSPHVSSPNSSRHSFDEALTPDSMDIVS